MATMATAASVFQELDEMKAMLDKEANADACRSASPARASASSLHATPRKPLSPGRKYVRETLQRSMDASFHSDLNKSRDEADRLDRAMEEAEEEMESAFRRAGDIHRVQIKRQEHEAQELRRLLAAKDRAIENMRDTISSTKRALDAKLAQYEAAMSQRDSEILHLQDQNKSLRSELRSLRDEAEKEGAAKVFAQDSLKRREAEAASKMAELNNIIKELSDDKSKLSSKLHTEILEKETVLKRVQTQQAELDAIKMERTTEKETARVEVQTWKEKHLREEEIRREYQKKYDSEKAKRKLASIGKEKEAVEMSEMASKLRSEKRGRKAAEKWLKAELNSREELETLFIALRDIALSKDKRASDLGLDEIAALLRQRRMSAMSAQDDDRYVTPDRKTSPVRRRYPTPSLGTPSYGTSALEHDFEVSRRLLSEDNAKLKQDLTDARRVLVDRLSNPPRRTRLAM